MMRGSQPTSYNLGDDSKGNWVHNHNDGLNNPGTSYIGGRAGGATSSEWTTVGDQSNQYNAKKKQTGRSNASQKNRSGHSNARSNGNWDRNHKKSNSIPREEAFESSHGKDRARSGNRAGRGIGGGRGSGGGRRDGGRGSASASGRRPFKNGGGNSSNPNHRNKKEKTAVPSSSAMHNQRQNRQSQHQQEHHQSQKEHRHHLPVQHNAHSHFRSVQMQPNFPITANTILQRNSSIHDDFPPLMSMSVTPATKTSAPASSSMSRMAKPNVAGMDFGSRNAIRTKPTAIQKTPQQYQNQEYPSLSFSMNLNMTGTSSSRNSSLPVLKHQHQVQQQQHNYSNSTVAPNQYQNHQSQSQEQLLSSRKRQISNQQHEREDGKILEQKQQWPPPSVSVTNINNGNHNQGKKTNASTLKGSTRGDDRPQHNANIHASKSKDKLSKNPKTKSKDNGGGNNMNNSKAKKTSTSGITLNSAAVFSQAHHADNMLFMPTHMTMGNGHKRGKGVGMGMKDFGMSGFVMDDMNNNTINMNNMNGVFKKGKVKIRRKKILSPLKKKILKERLTQWRKSQGLSIETGLTVGSSANDNHNASTSSIVYLKGYVQSVEELQDDEEYAEILHDLMSLANKVGPVQSAYIPRPNMLADIANGSCPELLVFVKFQQLQDASAATACWEGMVLGGDKLQVGTIPQSMLDLYSLPSEQWAEAVNNISYNELQLIRSNEAPVNLHERADSGGDVLSTIVILSNALSQDDLDDEECLEETLEDIRQMASEYGPIRKINGTEHDIRIDARAAEIRIVYEIHSDATIAVNKMNGLVLGGAIISARLDLPQIESETKHHIVILENILTEDDYEDEECLEAAKEDITTLAEKFGHFFSDVHVEVTGEARGRVSISYNDKAAAQGALDNFSGMVMGGLVVKAWLKQMKPDSKPILVLSNILTEDDYEDEDCLSESKADLTKILQKFGEVESIEVILKGSSKGQVSILFVDTNAIFGACKALNGMSLGSQTISAKILNVTGPTEEIPGEPVLGGQITAGLNDKNDTPEPMFSGNKIIPEQYAECKRAPKIPNAGVPRDYAKNIDDESVVPLLFEMLGELMRLQLRAKENKNSKAKRRVVMGLREVSRGIRANKVKMIVMANNLDQYGALDEKLQDILKLAKEHHLPVIFELNKRKLGKALGKTIKVSVVGVENAEGAFEPFKKLKRLCGFF